MTSGGELPGLKSEVTWVECGGNFRVLTAANVADQILRLHQESEGTNTEILGQGGAKDGIVIRNSDSQKCTRMPAI